MNRRQRVLALLDDRSTQTFVPAGFFIHFDPKFHQGAAAVAKHLEFFKATGMDFVKVQFETVFPSRAIEFPSDWASVEPLPLAHFEGQLSAVEGLVEAVAGEALVLVTLYSPFMCAGQLAKGHPEGSTLLTRHLEEDPEAVRPALQAVTRSLQAFVEACIDLGVDGFYTSTQGGEQSRFEDPGIFTNYIKPWDLELMERTRGCPFNILHICDYHDGYASLEPYRDYPGQVVNCSLTVGTNRLSADEVSRLFGRPFMGGLDRHGVISTGPKEAIVEAVGTVLRSKSDKFLLGADCTLPDDVDWDNLKVAIDLAHAYL